MRAISANDFGRTVLCDWRGCPLDAEFGTTRCREHRDLPQPPSRPPGVYTPQPGSRPAMVLEALAGGPMRVMDLQQACGDAPRGPFSFALHDLKKRGLIVRLAHGVYGLPGATVLERGPAADVSAVVAAPTGKQPPRSETAAAIVRDAFKSIRAEIDRLERELLDDLLDEAA